MQGACDKGTWLKDGLKKEGRKVHMAPSVWHRGHLPLQIGKQPGPELGIDEIKSKQTNTRSQSVGSQSPPQNCPETGGGGSCSRWPGCLFKCSVLTLTPQPTFPHGQH